MKSTVLGRTESIELTSLLVMHHQTKDLPFVAVHRYQRAFVKQVDVGLHELLFFMWLPRITDDPVFSLRFVGRSVEARRSSLGTSP